ncbi:alpha-ketoglutarate-dependent dioxygenase AlkB family protein [Flammeovirga agarivorans]|uniref:Alpha-ketoglutarate-dependent dioxygenase AlkB n=1 Tax=Flammeovirga agarivorans TaxID=2726742 RepID=A0A7X8SNR0_9BACT|nr:alpha-ketoglutarate-dependent dioxygenase AlkB [Flammeovirga agarivorans]NLR93537.1 alpha-ketoglutarate-dependent dioxygenase AlkB [Flammeovirga agarivorans]
MLSLFDQNFNQEKNLLPYDGEVLYYGKILSQADATHTFQHLMKTIEWQNDIVNIFGKEIITKRKMAWYGTSVYDYTYSNITRRSLLLTKELQELLGKVEEVSKENYNSCLLNLYHDGSEGMGYHSDDEKDMKEFGTIASLSLGAERKFSFKHKESKERIDILLEHGSLLLMKGETQKYWKHALPKSKKVIYPRINLTFRSIHLK